MTSDVGAVAAVRLRTVDGHSVIEDIDLDGERSGVSWLGAALDVTTVRFRHVSEPFE